MKLHEYYTNLEYVNTQHQLADMFTKRDIKSVFEFLVPISPIKR